MFQHQTDFIDDTVEHYFSDISNKESFQQSLTDCYQNPQEILDRVLRINCTVFVSQDTTEKCIKGYLFFNDTEKLELNVDGKLTKCIYNGFALVNKRYRQTGALQELIEYSMEFLKKVHNKPNRSLLFYAVTSNPIALRGYYKILLTARPQIDKELNEEDLKVAAYLKDKFFAPTEVNGHPFTFKTGLPQRYTSSVRQTINKSNIDEANYLNRLGINEGNGDRFLFYWTA